MKAFKKLKEIILDNLSLKDFFMSDVFRNHLTGIVKMVSGRYGNEEMFVKTRWGGKDIAYTDNRTVFVNLNNQIIEGVNDPEERYLCLLGFLGHELGHVLYTDFDSSEDFCLGKKGKYLGLNDKEKKIADEISDYRAKGFTEAIAEIAHRICNNIEDGFVNRKISETFPGTFKQGIKKLHSIQFKEELKSVGNPLTDAINAILSLSLGYSISSDIRKSVDCSDELEKILKGINKAETPNDRKGLTNRCLTVVWKYLKPILDVAEQMADSQNGNDGKEQQSGSSLQSGSNSSQGSSSQSSQSQSNDGCGASAVSKILKQVSQNSQTGKGKGILNKRTQNSSSQGSNTKNSQNKTGGQQNNRQKASSQNDKCKDELQKSKSQDNKSQDGGSDSSKDDFTLGSQNNISEDKEETENQNNTSAKEDESNQNNLSQGNENSANSSSKDNEASGKNNATGDNKETVEHNDNSDSKEDNKQVDEKDKASASGEVSENCSESKSSEETELSQKDENTSDYGDNGYNSETEDNNSDNTQDFGDNSFEEKTTFTDMPETPSDATFDGQTGTGEQDIMSALEGLLSQYAKKYAEQNPEKVEKLMLEENAKEVASGNNSPHNGYPFTVDNIRGSNNYRYDLAAKRLSGISKRLQKRVEQILEDQNDGGVCKNLLMGNKINPAASASSHGKIFKRNILPETKDIAVSVLIDESGSMSGNRIEKALEMAIIIEDFCAGLNIPLSIVGHCDSCGHVCLRNYIRFEDINKNRKYNLAEMRAGGCNRDGFALGYCVKNLLEREEENKLMIIISDGKPNSTGYSGALAEKDLRSIKTEFERKGGRLIAAAIGDDRDTIKRIYVNSFLDVTDINNLPLKMASIISRYVQN